MDDGEIPLYISINLVIFFWGLFDNRILDDVVLAVHMINPVENLTSRVIFKYRQKDIYEIKRSISQEKYS